MRLMLVGILALTALGCDPEPSASAMAIPSAVPNPTVTCVGVPESKCFAVVDDIARRPGVWIVLARVSCSMKPCTPQNGAATIRMVDATGAVLRPGHVDHGHLGLTPHDRLGRAKPSATIESRTRMNPRYR